MAIPRILHPMLPQDSTLTTFRVHKRYGLSGTTLTDTSSGYIIWNAVHSNKPTPIGSQKAANDPTNSFDGSYQHIIWNSIDAQYYRFNDSFEHNNSRYTYKNLNYSASILSLPYLDYGESIKPGSVEFTQSVFLLTDDQNGNLYDQQIETGSFTKKQDLISYWGFNDTFKNFRFRDGKIENGRVNYQSSMFSVDRPSYVKNVNFETGLTINNIPSGMSAKFTTDSYILTEHKDEFNFTDDEDFTISFWLKSNNSSSYSTILNKNNIIEKMEYGNNNQYQNDLIVNTLSVTRSFVSETTNVYPYKFDIISGSVKFTRSDGTNEIGLTGTNISDSNWHHIGLTKSGSMFKLYQDSNVISSGSKILNGAYNKHSLQFGLFDGNLDEIRFYNTAYSQNTIITLANNSNQSPYQTGIVGNVFYRRGNIVISSFDPKYLNIFNNTNWTCKYRGTHTIYQRELLVRIKKSQFNLSQNKTALQNYKTDLLIPEMVDGTLLPFFTTIGFYDDDKNLLAVAKMNQPIQLRDDVDLNILTKIQF